MPSTVENQRILHINRDYPKKDFLQIKTENWMNANKDLTPYGLQLYLYFAGNAHGFNLSVSPQDAYNRAGITRGTFHKYFNLMQEKKYIVHKQGNIFDFYETPKIENSDSPDNIGGIPNCEQLSLQNNISISSGE